TCEAPFSVLRTGSPGFLATPSVGPPLGGPGWELRSDGSPGLPGVVGAELTVVGGGDDRGRGTERADRDQVGGLGKRDGLPGDSRVGRALDARAVDDPP